MVNVDSLDSSDMLGADNKMVPAPEVRRHGLHYRVALGFAAKTPIHQELGTCPLATLDGRRDLHLSSASPLAPLIRTQLQYHRNCRIQDGAMEEAIWYGWQV